MRLRARSLLSALLFGAGTVQAQATRENAVAIELLPMPPADDVGVERLTGGLRFPWSLAFLPDERILIVEKHVGLSVWHQSHGLRPVTGTLPANPLLLRDSGLLDVALDPDFLRNSLLYLSYVEGSEASNRTSIWRARWTGDALVDGRRIFTVNASKTGPAHPGGRMLFLPDQTLLLSVGDGFDFRDSAQAMTSHLGKVLRLDRNGQAPADNPFVGRSGYAPELWTTGHRNVQGLAFDAEAREVWASDHGPRGGDRIHRLRPGLNFGWPRITHGLDYDGSIIATRHADSAFASSQMIWMPSIAPSGLAVYRGDAFAGGELRLLAGGLASRALHRLRVAPSTGLLVEEARMFASLRERVRDVRVSPEGNVYVLTDDERNGQLLRLARAETRVSTDDRLDPLAFLIGRWSGESRFQTVGSTVVTESLSTTDCRRAVQNRYLRCTTDFVRPNGSRRVVEMSIQVGHAGGDFEVLILNGNAAAQSRYAMRWDAGSGYFVGHLPTTHGGKAATERIVVQPSADRRVLVHTEAIRVNSEPNAQWTETFRWTWRRQ